MTTSCTKERAIAIVFFCILLGGNNGVGAAQIRCHDHEREALIKFKSRLHDPHQHLSSWDHRPCCEWRGVHCDNQTGYVLELNLRSPYIPCSPFQYYDTVIPQHEYWNLSGQLDTALLELKHLQILDLSSNAFDGVPIPSFLGSLKNLKYLNLSYSGFSGQIPHQLGNLSKLEELDLSADLCHGLASESLDWLNGMPLLKGLHLNSVDLSLASTHWVHVLNNLPFLSELRLSGCHLPAIASTLHPLNFTSLHVVDLSWNSFQSKIPTWVANISQLESIDLSFNKFHGPVPNGFSELRQLQRINLASNYDVAGNISDLLQGSWKSIKEVDIRSDSFHGEIPGSIANMTYLVSLDLRFNDIGGRIPENIGNSSATYPFPHLKELFLSENNLTGAIPSWLGTLQSLEVLQLDNNMLRGAIPTNFGDLSSLRFLEIENNYLNGSIPTTLWNLSQLQYLNLANNSFTGVIDDTNLEKLKRMTMLDLSYNKVEVHLRSNWVPSFQLEFLDLTSCTLGPLFPQWLKTQKFMFHLTLSNTFVKGQLPSWFWDFASQLTVLDLSSNKIQGQLPNPLALQPGAYLDLSFNNFSGLIPSMNNTFFILELSNNQFSGPIPQSFKLNPDIPLPGYFSVSENQINGTIPITICDMGEFAVLDLSRNHLVGKIPTSLANCSSLEVLDLSDNYLVGEIPWSLGGLERLASLHLSKNQLSGEMPMSFRNCSYLQVLDLGGNNLSGSILPVINDSPMNIRILSLRSNRFTGRLPSKISYMSSLQFLDLSNNRLSGPIPRSIGELTGLTRTQTMNGLYEYGRRQYYTISSLHTEKLLMLITGQVHQYDKTLYLVTGIDLSSNDFYGEIPEELMRLTGLLSLNLSYNHLTGKIPVSIEKLKWLLSLDLSNNQLSGEIPASLAELTFLAKLNLSNNHLRGRIPSGNQLQTLNDPSIYEGNVELCDFPLEKCPTNGTKEAMAQGKEDGDGHFEMGFYVSISLGFIFGFWGLFGLLFFKMSVRIAYYHFFDAIMEKLVTLVVLCLAKMKIKTEENRG